MLNELVTTHFSQYRTITKRITEPLSFIVKARHAPVLDEDTNEQFAWVQKQSIGMNKNTHKIHYYSFMLYSPFLAPATIPDIVINRHLSDNTFSLDFNYEGLHSRIPTWLYFDENSHNSLINMPVVQINNQVLTNRTHKIRLFPTQIHFSAQQLNNFKFDKINNLTVGVSPNRAPNKYLLFNLKMQQNPFLDQVVLQSNNVLEITYVNQIKINIDQAFAISHGVVNYVFQKKYLHVLLQPTKIMTQQRIKTLYKVAVWSDNGFDIADDFQPFKGVLNNVINNKLTQKLAVFYDPNDHEGSILGHPVNGTIKINNLSFYDYDTHTTKLGFNGFNARQGYVIPYNFQGIWRPNMVFPFNQVNWPFQVISEYLFREKLLDLNEGKIRLIISNKALKSTLKHSFWLHSADFERIIKFHYSLKMLESLHEKNL